MAELLSPSLRTPWTIGRVCWASLALEMFTRRAAAVIVAAATCLPSVGTIVFTGGIGENSAVIRAIGVPQIPAGDGADDRVLATGGVQSSADSAATSRTTSLSEITPIGVAAGSATTTSL